MMTRWSGRSVAVTNSVYSGSTLAAHSGEPGRRNVLQGAVRPLVVVVLTPAVDDAAYVVQAGESVLKQALISKETNRSSGQQP